MPFVSRNQVLEALEGFSPAGARDEVDLAALLVACGLIDKPLYRPEEVAVLGRAMMSRAQSALAAVTPV